MAGDIVTGTNGKNIVRDSARCPRWISVRNPPGCNSSFHDQVIVVGVVIVSLLDGVRCFNDEVELFLPVVALVLVVSVFSSLWCTTTILIVTTIAPI